MKGYHNKPEETEAAFVRVDDDPTPYFKTGDYVEMDQISGVYTIKGRLSSDIIKHKGYKVSALDIENVLLAHSCISECAVVGVDHDTHGQSIAAVVVRSDVDSRSLVGLSDLQALCKDELADYQTPQQVVFVDELPRNAMGKVNKKELVKQLL